MSKSQAEASQTKDGVVVVMKAKSEWSGKLAFDIRRHRIYMRFRHDWPTYTGQQLREGLLVELQAGQESLLLVKRYANNTNGQ